MQKDRALAVLFFIRDYLESQGIPPDEAEIADFFNMSLEKTASVVQELVDRGEVEIQKVGRVIVLKNHRIVVRNGRISRHDRPEHGPENRL